MINRDSQTRAVKRIVIIGGGPAGTNCATHAARLGADVTLIESDIVGGAAHLLDCIPSKAMIATGGAMSMMNKATAMGLAKVDVVLDFEALRTRIADIEGRLESSVTSLLSSQGVRLIEGR
ncbi:MAG: FAD-dependent oxidoreductase, partial [Acidimicrobiia bacterium]|nr:FAD-dependent oxidoreductase [Acidimicrobiia bacterium]